MHAVPLWLLELSAFLGVIQPPFVAVLKQDHLSQRVNTIIAVAFSTVVALVTCEIEGKFNARDISGSLIALYAVASALYAGLWKPTGIDTKIQTVTSILKPPAPVKAPAAPPAPPVS